MENLNQEYIRDQCQDLYKALEPFTKYLTNYSFIPFSPVENPTIIAGCTDGSFNVLWQATRHTSSEIFSYNPMYIGAVQVATVEGKYITDPKPDYKILFQTDPLLLKINLEHPQWDQGKKLQVADVLNTMMETMERYRLYLYAKHTQNRIIMMDGSLYKGSIRQDNYLQIDDQKENAKLFSSLTNLSNDTDLASFNTKMQDLVQICRKNHHMLVGISKQTKLIDNVTNMSYEVMIPQALRLQHLEDAGMFYIPIETIPINPPIHILFAKLHPHARLWHRIDYIDTGFDLTTQILPTIAQFAKYTKILGTTYISQIAHRIAVTLSRLGFIYDPIITRTLHQNGFTFDEIYYGKTNQQGSLVNPMGVHDAFDFLF